ncbi:MAG: hypothetical protein IKG93_10005 [Clostridiales bacterium]|nr:hypothetical protein [Clostridiales bacterium]
MKNYDDIIHLKRPQYEDLPPMPVWNRAAQFSPFAALVGYDDAVLETARLTDRRREMSDEEVQDLNAKLSTLSEMMSKRPQVRVEYFIPDPRKEGGRYEERNGSLRTIDSYNGTLIFIDGEKIPLTDTYSISILDRA